MDIMFWVWLGIIIGAAVIEIVTTDLISIWFSFGAILPFILATTTEISLLWQIVIFLGISATLIALLRKITLKYLFRNSDTKTNTDALIGQKFRLLEGTNFETLGKIKIKDVEWSVISEKQETIEKNKIVEIVKVSGNKFIVKECKEENKEDK